MHWNDFNIIALISILLQHDIFAVLRDKNSILII